jgi:acyl-CoA thioester hydrolase
MSDPPRPALEDGIFRHRITVPTKVIDMLGHANNTAYVQWIQDAAVLHSMHIGLPWEAYQKLGAAFVIRRHEIDYLRAVREGDAIDIATWVASMSQSSSVRKTEMRSAEGEPVLRAETTWIFVSLDHGRPTRIPDEIRQRFERKS